tara:strand:+ start:352 stop:639 length:288 start_codon:yes stop_codon:yes gene_type:complete
MYNGSFEKISYLNHEVFIFESNEYIEYDTIREYIDSCKDETKEEIIVLKEMNSDYFEYFNDGTQESDFNLDSNKEIALFKIENKHSLIPINQIKH